MMRTFIFPIETIQKFQNKLVHAYESLDYNVSCCTLILSLEIASKFGSVTLRGSILGGIGGGVDCSEGSAHIFNTFPSFL